MTTKKAAEPRLTATGICAELRTRVLGVETDAEIIPAVQALVDAAGKGKPHKAEKAEKAEK